MVLTADIRMVRRTEWSAGWRLSPRDPDGNALRGGVTINSSNVLVRSEEAARRRHRPQGRGRRRDWRCRPSRGKRRKLRCWSSASRRRAVGDARGRPAPLPALGLLSKHQPGLALPGQRDLSCGPAGASRCKSTRRRAETLGGRARRGRSDGGRQGRTRARNNQSAGCRSAQRIGSPTPENQPRN